MPGHIQSVVCSTWIDHDIDDVVPVDLVKAIGDKVLLKSDDDL